MTLLGTVCRACYDPSWDMAASIVDGTWPSQLTAMESVAELTSIMERTSIVELTAIVDTGCLHHETYSHRGAYRHGHLNRDTLGNGASGML